MIQADHLCKNFEAFPALSNVSCSVPRGSVYGMVGSNGAGKSTFLRLIAGVYKPDSGSITLDGTPIFENPNLKSKIVFVPDEPYFLPGATIERMTALYQAVYPNFDKHYLSELLFALKLSQTQPISTFSKGMKRQAVTALALSCRADYLLFDETFDGMDPIMRSYAKNLICEDILARKATAIITSHSLRELEDTCDQLALLHRGGLILESDVQNLKTSQFKIQIAFAEPYDETRFSEFNPLHYVQYGSVASFLVHGEQTEILHRLQALSPILLEILPLSLEEIFTYEMEALGYAFSTEEGGFSL